MKNKLSLFAVPYVGWMSIFVVAPIIIMVVYAFSAAADKKDMIRVFICSEF